MDEDLLHDERRTDDYEPISSPGRTLGLFLGIVGVAAICFGIGYRLGRQAEPPANTVASLATATSNIPKPSAAFSAAAPTTTSSAATADPAAQPSPESAAPGPASAKAPEIAHAAPTGNFAVQVAAVSKEEDADALVSALRKKDYPVFVVNPSADKLFHVQVGPFASLADAESMRARLASDGYNPIVKK